MMPRYFIGPDGYFEAITDIPTPAGVTEVPKRPFYWSTWIDGAWVTGAEPQPTLAEQRAGAVLSRAEFCVAMVRDGWWTKAQARAFAKGDVPPEFVTILALAVTAGAITQDEADIAEITAAGLVQVERSHPVIPIAAQVYDMTEAEVDALFGIV